MADLGGSVTLIFYKIGDAFWREPFLNLVAAAVQLSSFTHVEIAIGDEAGAFGQMSNVCRIFNDDVGVELTSRTGRNPQYSYVQLGCSKAAEQRMLAYSRSLVGRPFSNSGMARSVFFPRTTDGTSFFCAELVAAILKQGGLMSAVSNPGAATPQSLHRMYRTQAAVTANPYVLRSIAKQKSTPCEERARLIGFAGMLDQQEARRQRGGGRQRGASPPRAAFRCVSGTSRR